MPEWENILSGMGDFSDYMLESSPAMAYFSAAPFQGTSSPAQRQYWGSQYGNISNEYAGALGTALKQGTEAPSFVDLLSETPWTERYTSLSPALRPGGSFRRFAPQTQYAYR